MWTNIVLVILTGLAFLYSAAVGIAAVVFASILPFFLMWLARGNVLFTTVKEGTAKAVMVGDSFHHFVMSLKGYHLNDPRKSWYIPTIPAWEVLRDEPGRSYDDRSMLTRWIGVHFVGIPGIFSVHEYRFHWNEIRKDKEGKNVLWARDEPTDFIYTADFPYAEVTDEAENREGLPLDVIYQQSVAINNPFKALFGTENWLEQTSGASGRRSRSYVGRRTYEQLLSETHNARPSEPSNPLEADSTTDTDDDFSRPITELSSKLPDDPDEPEDADNRYERGLRGRYGVTIRSADLLSIKIVGPTAAQLLEATTKKYTADKQAYATVASGRAQAVYDLATGSAAAEVIRLKGVAQAAAVEARMKAIANSPQVGLVLAQLDAMSVQGEGRTYIWANNPFLRGIGLDRLFEEAGIKTPAEAKSAMTGLAGGTATARAIDPRLQAIANSPEAEEVFAQLTAMSTEGADGPVTWADNALFQRLGLDRLFEDAGAKTPAEAIVVMIAAQAKVGG